LRGTSLTGAPVPARMRDAVVLLRCGDL